MARFVFRIPDRLYTQLQRQAADDQRSVNAELLLIVEDWLSAAAAGRAT